MKQLSTYRLKNASHAFATILFFSSLFIPLGGSAQSPRSEAASCKITLNQKSFELKLNEGGYFQRLDIRSLDILLVEVFYPNGKAGEAIVAQVLDGGNINGENVVKQLILDNQKMLSFDFHTTSNVGLFRVLLTKGYDQKIVQVWAQRANSEQTESEHGNTPDCTTCGNPTCSCGNGKSGPDCKTTTQPPNQSSGTNPFDPYTGNVSRDVRDLELWGAVGEVPMKIIRYGNSRNVPRNWQLSFLYLLFDAGVNTAGQAQIDVHYPEGGADVFTQTVADPSKWTPLPGIGARIFQYGDNFYLQLANGHRYRYEREVVAGTTYFRLREFRDQFQNVYTVSFDAVTRKRRITEPGGRYLVYTFTNRSNSTDPIHIITNDGRSVQYNYDTIHDGVRQHIRLRTVNYGDGTQAQYSYTQLAPGIQFDLTHAIDPRVIGSTPNMQYAYLDLGTGLAGVIHQEKNGASGEVMVTRDGSFEDKRMAYPNGRIETKNMPDSQMGWINRYTDGVGATWQYIFDDNGIGFLKSYTDPLGRITTYNARTIYGNPLEITHPDGSNEKWTRDTLDQVLTYTDQLGRITTYSRDSRHRPTRIDFPDGTFETFTYNSFSQILVHRKKNSCLEHFAYSTTGLKTSFTDCDGKVTTYAYDAADRLNMVTDARGNSTLYQYSERGLLTRVTHPDNSFFIHTFDAFGNQLTTINELGKTWTTSYDEFKRPTTKKDPLNRTTTYSYDLPGGVCGCGHEKDHPTKITFPSGKMVTMTYDVEWRMLSKTLAAGTADAATTHYQYDLADNLIQTSDPRGKLWKYEYDDMDRKKAMTDPLNNRTEFTYDLVGNKLTEKRPNNGLATHVYDIMNRTTQTTDPKAQVVKYMYDADGNMVKLTDPKNNDYVFEYDALDRKTKMIYPGGSFEQYTYDAVSNLKTYTNRNSGVRTYTYDNRNREIMSDWSDATPDVTTTYDVAGSVLTITSSVSVLGYTYSDANEILSETQQVTGLNAKTVNYDYNVDGIRNSLTYPDGAILTYDYTNRNQLATISQGAPAIVQYSYDANGNRIGKTFNNGTNTMYSYDDASRLLSMDHQKGSVSFANYNYGYDNISRRTFLQYDNAKGDVYSYDAIDQVTGVLYDATNPDGTPSAPTKTVNYLYDPSGNRVTLTDNGVPTTYITNSQNQYTAVGANPATYNTNGSLANFDGWTYTYDAQERLIQAQKAAAIIDFVYDGRNRCIKRSINGIAIYLFYDGWSLIDERNASNVQLNRYIHGPIMDEMLLKVSPSNTVYYYHDALGDITRLTNNLGNVVEQYSYDVFGAPTIKNAVGTNVSSSAFNNRFMFTGREYIQEVNFYDYRNRIYHPTIGRFQQTDPLLFGAGDDNLYRYVGNNSTNQTDPFGLISEGCIYRCELVRGQSPGDVALPPGSSVNPNQGQTNPLGNLNGFLNPTVPGNGGPPYQLDPQTGRRYYHCAANIQQNCPACTGCRPAPFNIGLPSVLHSRGARNRFILLYVPCQPIN